MNHSQMFYKQTPMPYWCYDTILHPLDHSDHSRCRDGAAHPQHAANRHSPILGIAAFALFLALVNAVVKPILNWVTQILALPFSIMSLGLISIILLLIVNWLCMRLASWLAVSLFGVGVYISGFFASIIGTIIMSIVSAIVDAIIGE